MDSLTYKYELPIRWDCDIAVVGGGIAGVCAACAAARSGASVVLVERFAASENTFAKDVPPAKVKKILLERNANLNVTDRSTS